MEVSTALHAERILEAWDGFNYARFEAELDSALKACRSFVPVSQLEREERAVLESVVQQFQNFPSNNDRDESYRLGASVQLLRHLQSR